jgi:hypothetical protein
VCSSSSQVGSIGTISIVFVGRSKIGGIDVGTRLRAQGVASDHRGRLAILNPTYQLTVRP